MANTTTVLTLGIQGTAGGGAVATPTGTGIPHIVAGVFVAAASLIINADVSVTAAIAGSKIAPDFGAQNIITTGTATVASVALGASGPTITTGTGIPATAPPNGSLFLRSDGTSATTAYVRAAGAWTALSAGGGGGSTPTGTGLRKVVAGVEDAAASLLLNANVDAAAAIAVTKLAAGTSTQHLVSVGTTPTWVTPGGDVTGAVDAAVVARINGTTVPAGGALTTGHVLTVTGVSSATWQANAATVTWANDLAGSTNASQTIVKITGDGSRVIVAATARLIEWAEATSNPTILLLGRTTDAATSNTTLKGQDAWASAATNTGGGPVYVQSGAPAGAGAAGPIYLRCGAGTEITINTASVVFTPPALSWAQATASPSFKHTARTTDAATTTLLIQAQNAFASATTNVTGANLYLSAGSGTTVANSGQVHFLMGNTSYGRFGFDLPGAGTAFAFATVLPVGSTAFLTQDQSTAGADGATANTLKLLAQKGKAASNQSGGLLVIHGGEKVGTGVDGKVSIGSPTYGDITTIGGSTKKTVVWGSLSGNFIRTEEYDATTTATTANTVIATVPLTNSATTNITVKVFARQSTTNWATLQHVWSYIQTAGVITAATGTQPSASDLGSSAGAGTAIALNYAISTTNIQVRVTPWTATSTNWHVIVEEAVMI